MANYDIGIRNTLPRKALKNTQKLLRRMNDRNVYIENSEGTLFLSEIHNRIRINGNLELNNKNLLKKPVNSRDILKGEAELKLKNNGILIQFDKQTGRITSVNNPSGDNFLLQKTITGLNKQLVQAVRDFKKPEVVKQLASRFHGLTEKGHILMNSVEEPVQTEMPKKRQNQFLKMLNDIRNKIKIMFRGN